MIVQELKPPDFQNRVNHAQEMINRIPVRSTFFSSDEAHFHLSEAVNKKNFRYWTENNPREAHERLLHSPKVTVLVCHFEILGDWALLF